MRKLLIADRVSRILPERPRPFPRKASDVPARQTGRRLSLPRRPEGQSRGTGLRDPQRRNQESLRRILCDRQGRQEGRALPRSHIGRVVSGGARAETVTSRDKQKHENEAPTKRTTTDEQPDIDRRTASRAKPPATVGVWDPFVRAFHWSLVTLVIVALATGDEVAWLHLVAGYAIVVLVILRILWGFVGSRHARFSDFVRPPSEVLRFVGDSVRLKAPATSVIIRLEAR